MDCGSIGARSANVLSINCRSNFGRSRTVKAFECAVKIRKIAKAAIDGISRAHGEHGIDVGAALGRGKLGNRTNLESELAQDLPKKAFQAIEGKKE